MGKTGCHADIFEIKEKLVTEKSLAQSLKQGTSVYLYSRRKKIIIGSCGTTKINVLLGVSAPNTLKSEIGKVEKLCRLEQKPDLVTDLSIIDEKVTLYDYIIRNTDILAGSVPIYRSFNNRSGFDRQILLEEFIKQAEVGVKMFTLHITPSLELIEKAYWERKIPTTSRGGGLVVRDMLINKRAVNILQIILPEIIKIARKHKIVLSIGASFRPANIFDSLDAVHKLEMQEQFKYAKKIHSEGIGVLIEAPGHCPLAKIEKVAKYIKKNVPFPVMPLGPIPGESTFHKDHISASIGASFFGYFGCSDVICPITNEEHTGGIPSINSIIEAFNTARTAAHILDILKLGYNKPDRLIAGQREKHSSCISEKNTNNIGCSRCSTECPYYLKTILDNYFQE